MFGYVNVNKPELKVREYYQFKAYYCGLCRKLKELYGPLGQMTLSYDMTFAIVLLTSLYEQETEHTTGRCLLHPAQKHDFLINEITEYAAKMNLVLAYYHFLDDWADEHKASALVSARSLHRQVQSVRREYPVQCRAIRRELGRLRRLEAQNCTDLDQVSACFGRLMGAILLWKKDGWAEPLRRLGFFLGKFIYLMDAWEDLEEDKKEGRYNVLSDRSRSEEFEQECGQILNMMMAECSRAFEQLPCLQDAGILRNILYAGVWNRYDKLRRQREEGKEQENEQPL